MYTEVSQQSGHCIALHRRCNRLHRERWTSLFADRVGFGFPWNALLKQHSSRVQFEHTSKIFEEFLFQGPFFFWNSVWRLLAQLLGNFAESCRVVMQGMVRAFAHLISSLLTSNKNPRQSKIQRGKNLLFDRFAIDRCATQTPSDTAKSHDENFFVAMRRRKAWPFVILGCRISDLWLLPCRRGFILNSNNEVLMKRFLSCWRVELFPWLVLKIETSISIRAFSATWIWQYFLAFSTIGTLRNLRPFPAWKLFSSAAGFWQASSFWRDDFEVHCQTLSVSDARFRLEGNVAVAFLLNVITANYLKHGSPLSFLLTNLIKVGMTAHLLCLIQNTANVTYTDYMTIWLYVHLWLIVKSLANQLFWWSSRSIGMVVSMPLTSPTKLVE